MGPVEPGWPGVELEQPAAKREVNGNNLVFAFRRADVAKDMPSVSIAAEYGSGLTGWTIAQDGINGVTITASGDFLGDGVYKVTVSAPMSLASDSKLFARIHPSRTWRPWRLGSLNCSFEATSGAGLAGGAPILTT